MILERAAVVLALLAAAVMLALSHRTLLRATMREGRPSARALRAAACWDTGAVAALVAGGVVFGLGSKWEG